LRITGQDDVNTISKSQTGGIFDAPNTSARTARAEQNPDAGTDQVDLGGQTGLLSQAQSAPSSDRAARLDEIRQLVQSGQYQVDSSAVSQSIIAAALNGF